MIETAREALSDLDEFLSGVAMPRFQRELTTALTDRERDVLELLADGYTTQEVADRLAFSHHTIRSRVKAILAKLEARTREQAVAIAIREGIL